jgi:hypothetical protein
MYSQPTSHDPEMGCPNTRNPEIQVSASEVIAVRLAGWSSLQMLAVKAVSFFSSIVLLNAWFSPPSPSLPSPAPSSLPSVLIAQICIIQVK